MIEFPAEIVCACGARKPTMVRLFSPRAFSEVLIPSGWVVKRRYPTLDIPTPPPDEHLCPACAAKEPR